MTQNLAQLGQQLAGIWKQLGLNQKISVSVAALAVAAGLAGLVWWSSRADYSLLYGRVDEAEAAKIVAVLDDAKVPYRLGQGAIYVPANKVHAMRMQMATKGIRKSGEAGFEILDKTGFGLSEQAQRVNYQRAVQGELARTISQIDEIEAASVMVVMPENRLILDNNRRPTASVFVKVKGHAQLPPPTVSAIQSLVANSVEGLQASHVSVMDNHGLLLSSEISEPDSVAGLTASQFALTKNREQYLAKKAEGMLEKVLGPGQAVVRVTAELNFESQTITKEKYDPEGQVKRSETIKDTSSDTVSGAANGGTPGVTLNADPTATNSAPDSLSKTTTKTKENTSQYEIDKTVSSITQMPGGVKRITAAVFVAARTSGSGTNRVVVPRSPEEMQKLRRIVQTALGIVESDPNRKDEIALEEMPFNDAFGVELTQQMEQQQKHQVWLEAARNLAYPALGLLVLAGFWRAFRKTPVETIPLGVPVGELAGNGNGNGNGRKPGNGNGHGTPDRTLAPPPGVLTVEALNQLVRENPENMSQAIRAWMGRGRTPSS